MEFMDAIKNRRSIYGLAGSIPVSEERIIELAREATRYTPAAYNSQSQRTVVLFGESHLRLWDIALGTLRGIVPAESFAPTEAKLNSFRAAYGTVLYFSDDAVTAGLQEAYPLYATIFPGWGEQASAMLQFALWNLLEAEGVGASLQHYNPLIDDEVKAAFDLPASWRLIAQMPFGTPTAHPSDKTFADLDTRVKILR